LENARPTPGKSRFPANRRDPLRITFNNGRTQAQ
jgi:hypothetical protein